jgi:hypothetical protein
MTSNWALPNNVEQYSEEGAEEHHVSWLEIDNFNSLKSVNGRSTKTSRDLIHIARDPRHDILEKTYFLRLTNFNFQNLPSKLTGIELQVTMNRNGRITDDTVQLCIDGNLVGENQATRELAPIKLYGTKTDLWKSALNISNVQHNSFGVVLRFKSHPDWPHKSSALIDAVEIRIS